MAACKRVPVNVVYKRLMLVACFALMVIEYESGLLFLWPLDHACAKPANLSIFSELFVDSKSQPIDLNAVQRILFDATPEDSFTLARATSLGIDYDDVGRCFEYAINYADDNQPVFNMDILEPCRYGLRFEVLTPKMSIVDHYNLACDRQWLKILLPQCFAFGLLIGLSVTYFVWFPRGVWGHSPVQEHFYGTRNNLASWTGVNLITFVVLYLITLLLNQCYLNNSHKAAVNGSDVHHQELGYFLFVAGVFLRSTIIASVLCRILIKWKATSSDQSNSVAAHHRACFVAFAITLVALKIFFVPLALKVFDNWSELNLFLTLNQVLLLALTFMFELVKTRNRFHTLLESSSAPMDSNQTSDFQQTSLASSRGSRFVHGNEPLSDDLQQTNGTSERDVQDQRANATNQTPRLLLEIDEMRDTTRAAWANRWGAQFQRFEPAFKVCEFCSSKDEQIFGIMNHRSRRLAWQSMANSSAQSGETTRVDQTSGDGRQMDIEICDQRAGASVDDNANAYQPTTIPLDQYIDGDDNDDVTTGRTVYETSIERVNQTERCLELVTQSGALSELTSGWRHVSYGDDSLPRTTCAPTAAPNGSLWPSLFDGHVRGKLTANGMVEHNSSLFELSIGRWPLMSKLSLLSFCLALNYFLVQTIPNHKLQHAETMSSFMERKTNHRSIETSTASGNVHLNDTTTNKKSLLPFEMADKIVESVAINTTDKTGEFVYDPKLVMLRLPAPADPSQAPVRNNSETHLNLPSNVDRQAVADAHQHRSNGVLSTRPMAQDGLESALVKSNATESVPRDKQQRVNNEMTQAKKALTTSNQLKNNQSTINSGNSSSSSSPHLEQPLTVEQFKLQASIEDHKKYKYDTETVSLRIGGQLNPNGSKVDNVLKANGRVFNYNSVDYASQTIERLVSSWNPLEIGWVMMELNGWPIEFLVILLHTSKLTNFESTYFKLTRLFSLLYYGSKVLTFEWLFIALIPKQHHLLEMEWLLAGLLLVARFVTSLMFYSYLRMLLKLGARLASSKLIVTIIETTPLVLIALALALWAPIFEKISLILIPLLLVANNLIIHYLARAIDDKFKELLCPMMFE